MTDTSPTRMNLLARRAQLVMANRGVELLEKKRDALVKEFFANVHEALEARRQYYKAAREAHVALVLAKSFDSPESVEVISLAAPVTLTAHVQIDNVWGTRVPRLVPDFNPGATMSPLAMGGRTVAAQATFQELCQVLIQVTNTESRMRRIAEEIKKTARRVNALRQAIIPGIRQQIRSIQQALDQQEQEDIFRLKRIKGKIEAQGQKNPESRL
jgi:V/A-type H+-transporting ATPase subunit D